MTTSLTETTLPFANEGLQPGNWRQSQDKWQLGKVPGEVPQGPDEPGLMLLKVFIYDPVERTRNTAFEMCRCYQIQKHCRLKGTRKKWDQWAGREKMNFHLEDLSEETQMKHWKQWSWKGCPRGFFIQEDLNVKPQKANVGYLGTLTFLRHHRMWDLKMQDRKNGKLSELHHALYSFQGWG